MIQNSSFFSPSVKTKNNRTPSSGNPYRYNISSCNTLPAVKKDHFPEGYQLTISMESFS